jgi:hypothetical protein
MLITDFKRNKIRHFTPEEITKDGSMLGAVSLSLITTLDDLRESIDAGISILCVTGGKHSGSTHAQGIAVDFTTAKTIDVEEMIWRMCRVGFRGIGIYRNKAAYMSYHGDVRKTKIEIWGAHKYNSDMDWTYINLNEAIP